jgi:DNA polymerase I-like protein with 3'-5' exonuclease and polymerase domains
MDSTEKDSMRELAIRGGPFSQQERKNLIEYCESDVKALAKLLPAMLPNIDIDHALLRGRYMKAAAQIEHNGTPIDTKTLRLLEDQWQRLPQQLIKLIDCDYGVFEEHTFKSDLFAKYLISNNISWPELASGKLDLKDETFRERAKAYPQLNALRELRLSLSQLRLSNLAVGSDGRNRCLLSAFQSRTGRNQPSNSKFIFGPSVWLRNLIKPQPGTGIAYIDWSQQEFGIAAALSNDSKMMEAYQSGDPYLAFAKQAGAVPDNATKESHKAERDQFKACVLAVQYGMGAESLAARINQPIAKARQLLQLHRETYRTFWTWSDAALDYAMLHNKLWTVFGWTIHTGNNPNPRFLRNFLMQGNGAEMLRLACCMLTESGIKICAPVHDAVLIESPLDTLDNDIKIAQQIMEQASAIILNGFTLRSDADVVRSPERYSDDRGKSMWKKVSELLEMNKSLKGLGNA